MLLPTAEDLIAADPEKYFNTATWNYEFDPAARKDYLDNFSTPEGIHGVRSDIDSKDWYREALMLKIILFIQSCEDYRAAATIDLEHDRADRKAGNKIKVEKLRGISKASIMITKKQC